MFAFLGIGATIVDQVTTVKPAVPKKIFVFEFENTNEKGIEKLRELVSKGWILKSFNAKSYYNPGVLIMEKY